MEIYYILYYLRYLLYIISPGLNQMNLIIYTTKFETFLLDPILKK